MGTSLCSGSLTFLSTDTLSSHLYQFDQIVFWQTTFDRFLARCLVCNLASLSLAERGNSDGGFAPLPVRGS